VHWLKRIGAGALLLLVVATAAGSAYEAWSRHRVAEAFPPRGTLVDIGGRLVHLDCRGSGTPVVVFESGLDIYGSLSWSRVQDAVAGTTRACSYDRAGIMWSDRAAATTSAVAIADDLHKTLHAAREEGPYVMVGHSLGGPYAMTFTRQFGAEVAGLVFVDASHPDQRKRIEQATGQPAAPPAAGLRVASVLAWTGLPRLLAPATGNPNAPAAANAAMTAYLPRSLPALVDEAEAIDATLQEAGTLRSLGDRPVVVLTAAAPPGNDELALLKLTREQGRRMQAAWFELHADEANWSSRGQEIRLQDAHHYIQFDRPDAVIDAIREVVTALRAEVTNS
jgi:pimeloyl-ACP methyl ester carboxylesterase